MGHVHYLKDLPTREYLLDPIERPVGTRHIVITLDAFLSIGDYTRSQPTAPSPGRVYKKNLHWTGPPSNWFVYVCEADPAEEGWTFHHPYAVILLDKAPDFLEHLGEHPSFAYSVHGERGVRT